MHLTNLQMHISYRIYNNLNNVHRIVIKYNIKILTYFITGFYSLGISC